MRLKIRVTDANEGNVFARALGWAEIAFLVVVVVVGRATITEIASWPTRGP